MDAFHALFWDTKVYLNKQHQYLNNEILVYYLNMDTEGLEELYDDLRYALKRILLSPPTDITKVAAHYDDQVQIAQKLMTKVDRLYLSLPPYSVCKDERKEYDHQLYQCLNRHALWFEDGVEDDSYTDYPPYPDRNEYGYLTCDDAGEDLFWLTHFDPTPILDMWEDPHCRDDGQDGMAKMNADIQSTIIPYLHWLEDVLRVKFVYSVLLDEFLHIKHAFLDDHEIAEQFEKYLKTEKNARKRHRRLGTSDPSSAESEVFRPQNAEPILCDSYGFDRIGAFLYVDFFRGMKNNHIPKKCDNCGKWFLLPYGKYSDYCENPLPDGSGKTCREVSARKKYDEKCKTDPVWTAYNRAYKAHYARYMKKKMTASEFEQWGTYAIELREKVLDKTLDFEEYQILLKV